MTKLSTRDAEDTSAPVTVESLTALQAQKMWSTEALHSEADHIVMWFSKGQGQINIGGVNRVFTPNTVIFLPARTLFSFTLRMGIYGTVIRVRQDAGAMLPDRPLHLRAADLGTQAALVSIVEALQRELRLDQLMMAEASVHHVGLLGVWLERQAAKNPGQQALGASERLVRKFATLVEDRYAQGESITEYARKLGVTPTHLTRCCRQAAGRTAHGMLQDRVLHEARARLRHSEVPVKQIARDLGFNSAAYFTRNFLAQTGQTPTAFRKAAPRFKSL